MKFQGVEGIFGVPTGFIKHKQYKIMFSENAFAELMDDEDKEQKKMYLIRVSPNTYEIGYKPNYQNKT